MLISPLEGLVDRSQVFQTALRRHEVVSSIVSWLISQHQAQGQPSLFDLWVGVSCSTKIFIDLLQDVKSHCGVAGKKLRIEDGLEVGVKLIVLFKIIWGRGSFQFDVVLGEGHSLS